MRSKWSVFAVLVVVAAIAWAILERDGVPGLLEDPSAAEGEEQWGESPEIPAPRAAVSVPIQVEAPLDGSAWLFIEVLVRDEDGTVVWQTELPNVTALVMPYRTDVRLPNGSFTLEAAADADPARKKAFVVEGRSPAERVVVDLRRE